MAPYWANLGLGGREHWNDGAPAAAVEQSRQERNVAQLEEVNSLFHRFMDGIIPTTLVTNESRQMFLETMESVSNEVVAAVPEESGGREDFRIPVGEELARLTLYANGVQDLDFRNSGMCPWEPVPPGIGVKDRAFKDHVGEEQDIPAAQKWLWDILKRDLVDE